MSDEPKKSPLKEIIQPFIDLAHAPRALWGVNLAYVLEGAAYFGMLGYLAIHFSDFVFQSVAHSDQYSHTNVMALTAGITIAMFFLGFVADKWGVRFALISAFILMLSGRATISAAPTVLGLEPARPGVFVDDKISLHVTELGGRDGIKAITQAEILANDGGVEDGVAGLAIDLAAGEGVAPNAALDSRLVRVSEASVVEGRGQDWQVQYGNAPVTARLLIHGAESLGLCAGATISLNRAYVTKRDGEGDEFLIRSRWLEDVGTVDTTGCEEAVERNDGANDDAVFKSESRWPIGEPSESAASALPVSIGELRAMEDGPVNVILNDVYVTYVRNGGYFLQRTQSGPAIYAYVSPLWSPLHLVTLGGILLIVIGYGMYQPAAYAAVRKFTTPKTAAMGFAMLYALMNLGGWLPTFAFLLRDENFLDIGIPGVFWVYTGFTVVALFVTVFILSKKTVAKAIARAKAETEAIEKAERKSQKGKAAKASQSLDSSSEGSARVPVHLWLFFSLVLVAIYFRVPSPWNFVVGAVLASAWIVSTVIPRTARALARHPLADSKFCYFIFALIPVQTLFTYNWLILPQYISRAFEGWIGEYFEIAANANPILIFVAVPIIAAMTLKSSVYKMMLIGTFIMAAPSFLLVIGPYWWTLAGYISIMTIGEAMWQPRFLQYAAEIAPEGRTGMYMGVAQLPWFLTKLLVPWLYSGWMMDRYCPADGEQNTQFMWLIFACIAMASTFLLLIAKPWVGKDFKTKAD